MVLEGAAADRCTVQLSPLAEMCACLHALGEIDHHPRSRAWAARVVAALGTGGLADCTAWAPLWGALRARFLYPLDPSRGATLTTELDAVESLAPRPFVAMCAEAITERDRGIRYDRIGLDPAPTREFRERAERLSPQRLALAERLLDDPAALRGALVAFLRSFDASVFDSEWRANLGVLRDDAQHRAHELDRNGLSGLARLTGTAQELERPHRVVFDKLYDGLARLTDQACLLIPSVHVRPHLIIKHNPGLPIVIQYAIGAVDEVSSDLVRNRMAVLHDPIRIKLCRWILREPHTTMDLARQLGMSEPQVSRHLRRLREAGLVRTWREGRLVFYSLETAALQRIGDDLISALRR